MESGNEIESANEAGSLTTQFTDQKKKKKALPSLLYLVFIVLLPWGVSFSFNKCLELWIKNWWNTRQSETLLPYIQEKRILERFIELEELSLLDEMIKEKLKTHKDTCTNTSYRDTQGNNTIGQNG
ncbi:hypothetical protein QYE76_003162 [Lolium multiflorum]|uniref:Chloroplast envelope membrane protein n=1 Tax=Lolium multiflorum TaxID=4521 RepID=A0AAD8VYZ7_LOLMU|nr:hypothetical protein QYE76_003162 [Lolium multiflorum]